MRKASALNAHIKSLIVLTTRTSNLLIQPSGECEGARAQDPGQDTGQDEDEDEDVICLSLESGCLSRINFGWQGGGVVDVICELGVQFLRYLGRKKSQGPSATLRVILPSGHHHQHVREYLCKKEKSNEGSL